MTIGAALFLIAIGAIAKYAVNERWDAVDLSTVGVILMVVGAIGLVVGLWQTFIWNRRDSRRPPDERRAPDEPPPG